MGHPGGVVNPGERPEDAARREVREETGLTITGELTLFWTGTAVDQNTTAHVYCAATHARSEDIILGEGAAMQYVPAHQVPSLQLASNTAPVLSAFLQSAHFQTLAPAADTAPSCFLTG